MNGFPRRGERKRKGNKRVYYRVNRDRGEKKVDLVITGEARRGQYRDTRRFVCVSFIIQTTVEITSRPRSTRISLRFRRGSKPSGKSWRDRLFSLERAFLIPVLSSLPLFLSPSLSFPAVCTCAKTRSSQTSTLHFYRPRKLNVNTVVRRVTER